MITTELNKELVMYVEMETSIKKDIKESKDNLTRGCDYIALEVVRGFIFQLFEDIKNEDSIGFNNLLKMN